MKIDNKLVFLKKKDTYDREFNEGNINPQSIVFVEDEHTIYTHGESFGGNSGEYATDQEVLDMIGDIPYNPQPSGSIDPDLLNLDYATRQDIIDLIGSSVPADYTGLEYATTQDINSLLSQQG